MYRAGQTAWGALPRRQRRLHRSKLKSSRANAVLVLTSAGCIGALVAYVSLWPLY